MVVAVCLLFLSGVSGFHLSAATPLVAAARPSATIGVIAHHIDGEQHDVMPTMQSLSAALAKAQSEVKLAKTRVELVNAQEVVDALCDRMDRQKLLENQPVGGTPSGVARKKEAALLAKLKVLLRGKQFPVNTESWKQIQVHED